jgi:DNA-binding beta-propeller fold protein YncE
MYGSSRPMGVAVSPTGDRVYVTESDGTRLVRVYDRAGKKIGTLKPPKATGGSHVPVYVAVDPINSDVYVSDRPSQSLFVYDQKGTYLRTFKPKGNLGGGYAPLGVAFDKVGNLYVTDVSGKTHRVLVFGRDGTLLRNLGTGGKLSFPNGIAIDAQGTAFVSDSNNGRVITFDPAGKQLATIDRGVGEGDLGLPRGAAIDNSNRLYVVDTSAHAVKVYRIATSKAPSARYSGSFGDEGQLDGTFEFPNGVATDTRSRIYVTDRENNRVQVWSY